MNASATFDAIFNAVISGTNQIEAEKEAKRLARKEKARKSRALKPAIKRVKEEVETEHPEMEECYCFATSFPPCSYCTRAE